MISPPEDLFKILVTDRFDDDAFAKLSMSKRIIASRSQTPDLNGDDLTDVAGLLIRSRTSVTRELLARAPKLKVVITSTSGYDHIDLTATLAAGVAVMFTPDANAASACELTWGLLIAAARKILPAHQAVARGQWKRESLIGFQFAGKTLGVVGLGRIGSRVARVGQAFGLKTVAHDPYKNDAYFKSNGCERRSLPEIFASADVVSCHVPGTPETLHMVSPELLRLSEGLIFANTSRGQVVAESALLEALDHGHVGVCGLDVFEQEPLPQSSPLLSRSNVVLTPHIGATTHEAFKAASMAAVEKILSFAERGMVTDSLP